jgi:signal transduction histidine kinase
MDGITHAGTLHGYGEIGALFHAFDWSSTELGSPGSWPDSLTIATSICLNSRFPMGLWWGRSTCTMIYNDAYRSVLGRTTHPRWFGRPGRECCPEIWDAVGPMVDRVFETGEPTWSEDMPLFIDRDLPREEAYFTISCSPIYAERDRVGGVLSAYTETTRRVLSEQRLGVLKELGARVSEGRTPERACEIARQTLDEARQLVGFALFYLVERCRARLVAASPHLNPHVAPERVDLTAPSASPWRLASVAASGVAEVIEDVFERVGPLPGGPWPEPARSALVVPLKVPGELELAGLLVIGTPTRRVVDLRYRTFIDYVAGHVATAIAIARAHERKRRRTDALAELDRAKTVFFRNISQEFRTPLTLMLGPAEDALTDTEDALTPAQRECVEAIYRSGQRLLKLVNTLLDFSRLEASRIDACYEPTDLASLTSEVASTFREVVERAGLQLVVDCPPLPEPVYVDRGMWEHIVLSLLSNAFKFTFNGEIVVRTAIDRGRVRLSVSDTGTGIREDELPLLFTRFHRVTGARARTDEGTGIGLSLVHGMAKLHRGQVEVQSEYGRGSTFTVTIPTGRAHLPADRIKAPQTPAPAAALARTYVAEAAHWLLEPVNATRPRSCASPIFRPP